MKVLVLCETSGIMRNAFKKKGHTVWSLDIEPADDGETEYHIQDDAMRALNQKTFNGRMMAKEFDLLIAHPPCQYLANSGVQHLYTKTGRVNKMRKAVDFFVWVTKLPIKQKCIENPIPHKYGIGALTFPNIRKRKDGKGYSQIVQPWQHGHGETKATCLYLENLPDLKPTKIVEGRKPVVHYMAPGPDRAKMRSKTYQGIANAMANQWG